MLVSQDPLVNATVTDLTTTWQLNFKTGSLAFWDPFDEVKLFNVLQFHVHAPSEHTVDGKNYDMELHMVHQSYDQQELAVLGVFFDVEAGGNQDNAFITALKLNSTSSNWTVPQVPLMNLISQLDFSRLYHYQGSLTTPPCTEIVTWLVVHDPQPISTKQLELFTRKWAGNVSFAGGNGNNRNTKALNSRTIYHLAESGTTHADGDRLVVARYGMIIAVIWYFTMV